MKICATLFLILGCVTAFGQIHLVEISPQRAIVHRRVTASPQEGRLLISDLPVSLDSASIQVNVAAPGSAQVSNVRFVHLNPENDPQQVEVTGQLKQIERAIGDLADEKKLIEARTKYELELAEAVRESLKTEAASDAFELGKRAWEEYSSTRLDARSRITAISNSIENLEEQKQQLQEQLQKIQQQSGQLVIDVVGAQDGSELLVELSYHVGAANWRPLYEVRADPQEGSLTWVCKAQIRQDTGENWDRVQVRLSTAAPQFTGMPELQPLVLGHITLRSSLDRGYLSKALPPPPSAVAYEDDVQLGRSTTSFHATLPAPLSLESGQDEIVREIFSGVTKASFWSQAAPELSPDAWLMAGGTLSLDWPILTAQALIFIDDHLVAKRLIESLKPGEEFELALGKNDNIAIQRTERRRNASEGGVFDRTRRVDVAFETVVSNFMPVPHRVILQERFPISRENKIQVRQEEPKDVTVEEGTGIFLWEREIQPGGNVTMNKRYIVSYPADWLINEDF